MVNKSLLEAINAVDTLEDYYNFVECFKGMNGTLGLRAICNLLSIILELDKRVIKSELDIDVNTELIGKSTGIIFYQDMALYLGRYDVSLAKHLFEYEGDKVGPVMYGISQIHCILLRYVE